MGTGLLQHLENGAKRCNLVDQLVLRSITRQALRLEQNQHVLRRAELEEGPVLVL